ncbi:MAG: AfsR/SARP family transcriptional regulator [Aldersonia sp.]|nr:AfsR/SARP family transcriptional regulator [Aldersonia sp.]
MRYEILGPLRVVDRDGSSSISARKIEILLAALLIRADHLVPADQLIAELWCDRPPRRATAGLHVYVSELRKFLGRPGGPDNRIVTRMPGYQLSLGSDEIDAHAFLRLVDEGREHVRDDRRADAAECFERALGLWRGPVLGDPPTGPMVEAFGTWLTEVRMECTEMLIDAQLRLDRHRELVGRLYSLTAEHPLRESFHRQLMIALYRSERTADALRVYQSARRLLNTELGLEPCRALQDVHRAILTADDRTLLNAYAHA